MAAPAAWPASSIVATATRFRIVGWGVTRTAASGVGDQIVAALRAGGPAAVRNVIKGAQQLDLVQLVAGGVLQVAFEARLRRDLEGLFRRGGEYAEGADAVLLLRAPLGGCEAAGGEDDI